MQYRRMPLKGDEPERMIAACKTPFELGAVGVLFEFGLRLAELNAIDPAEVDWEQRRIRVLGKGSKFRVLPISETGAKYLRTWIGAPKPKGAAALKKAVQRAFSEVGKRAGIERHVHCHLARHTFAVRCLQRGISLRTLQLLLAHSSLATTANYLNLSPDSVCDEFFAKWPNASNFSLSPHKK